MDISRDIVIEYIKSQYGAEPEFPWEGEPDFCVFRHSDNRKWFALIMRVRKDRLGMTGDSMADCMNLKIDDPVFRDILIQ